jgi:hypothetical protein
MLWTSKTVRKWWNLLFLRSLMTTEHCQRFQIYRNNWVVLDNHKHKQAIWSSFHHFNCDIRPKKWRFPRIIESNEHNAIMGILSLWNKMFHKRKELACWTLGILARLNSLHVYEGLESLEPLEGLEYLKVLEFMVMFWCLQRLGRNRLS